MMLLGGPTLPPKYMVPSISAVEMNNCSNLLYLQGLLVNSIPNYRIQHCQFHLEQSGVKHAILPETSFIELPNYWEFERSDRASELPRISGSLKGENCY